LSLGGKEWRSPRRRIAAYRSALAGLGFAPGDSSLEYPEKSCNHSLRKFGKRSERRVTNHHSAEITLIDWLLVQDFFDGCNDVRFVEDGCGFEVEVVLNVGSTVLPLESLDCFTYHREIPSIFASRLPIISGTLPTLQTYEFTNPVNHIRVL
jgi:hypothetical protein